MDRNMEAEKFDIILTNLCSELDKVINNDLFKNIEYKQKICVMSSFLEFIKAGADVRVLPVEEDRATFVIIMK